MKKSSKHEDVQPVKMILDGGLNYSSTPANLQDNELRRAHNFIYDPSTEFLVSRPGTRCVTTGTCGDITINLSEKVTIKELATGA
jgi:hypothetical protein